MKILVVDDSPIMRRTLVNYLNLLNLNDLVEAVDGFDAMEKLNSNQIEFIITDWNMPKRNGIEFINEVKKNEKYKNIPILMITSARGKDDFVIAIKAGVDNYLIKPYTTQSLKEKIVSILKKKSEGTKN